MTRKSLSAAWKCLIVKNIFKLSTIISNY